MVSDPNVDVIFISPVPMNDETLQYYNKLIGLKTAIDSGNVDDQSDLSDRYRIIVPEAIKSFPVSRDVNYPGCKFASVNVIALMVVPNAGFHHVLAMCTSTCVSNVFLVLATVKLPCFEAFC